VILIIGWHRTCYLNGTYVTYFLRRKETSPAGHVTRFLSAQSSNKKRTSINIGTGKQKNKTKNPSMAAQKCVFVFEKIIFEKLIFRFFLCLFIIKKLINKKHFSINRKHFPVKKNLA
jgi:hypothetical protein